jgi:hypothetical protein
MLFHMLGCLFCQAKRGESLVAAARPRTRRVYASCRVVKWTSEQRTTSWTAQCSSGTKRSARVVVTSCCRARPTGQFEQTSSEGRGRSATPPLPSSPPSSPLEGGATTQPLTGGETNTVWGVKSSGIFVSCVVCRRKFVYSLSGAGEIQYRRHAHETITIGYTQDARSRKGTDESTASYPQCIVSL